MTRRLKLTTLILAGAMLVPGIASAATAFATGNVNLPAGPSTAYPAVNVVPAGDDVRVFGCLSNRSWCDVDYYGQRGWMSSNYLAFEQRGTATPGRASSSASPRRPSPSRSAPIGTIIIAIAPSTATVAATIATGATTAATGAARPAGTGARTVANGGRTAATGVTTVVTGATIPAASVRANSSWKAASTSTRTFGEGRPRGGEIIPAFRAALSFGHPPALTGFRTGAYTCRRRFPVRRRTGIKREHGEDDPIGAETVAAPATVSGCRSPS